MAGSPVPFSRIGTLDELLERARSGQAATGALELVKDQLSDMKDETYLKLLNVSDIQLPELRAQLKAIELLARKLLSREASGEIAYRTLMSQVPGVESPKEQPFKATRVSRRRRPSAKDTTAQ